MDDHHLRWRLPALPGGTESGSQTLSTLLFPLTHRLDSVTAQRDTDSDPGPAADDRSAVSKWFFPDGEEPDPRFTLANERTFLAWMRTALAFIAGGVGTEALPDSVLEPGIRTFAALCAIAVGILLAAGSAVRWLRIERAMRRDEPLPAPSIVPVLSAGSILAAVLLGLMVLT